VIEMIDRATKTARCPNLSMDGPAIRQPTNLPIKAKEDSRETYTGSNA
jgi:hypothetical protein